VKTSINLALILLAGFSNIVCASPLSFSNNGIWTYADGNISYLLGKYVPINWKYDSEVSAAAFQDTAAVGRKLDSGGTVSANIAFNNSGSNYGLSTTGVLGELSYMGVVAFDNTVPEMDIGTMTRRLKDDVLSTLNSSGIDTTKKTDLLEFYSEKTIGNDRYVLSTFAFFDTNLFQTPLTSIEAGFILQDKVLFTYTALELLTYNESKTEIISTSLAKFSSLTPPSSVPIPTSALLFTPALLGFLGLYRRRQVKL
jgi:hypothetical protein